MTVKKTKGKKRGPKKGCNYKKLDVVKEALKKCNGNIPTAAEQLGVTYQALYHRVKKHKDLDDYRDHLLKLSISRVEDKMAKLLKSKDEKIVYKSARYQLDRYDRHNGLTNNFNISFNKKMNSDLKINEDTDEKTATEIYFKLIHSCKNKE